MLSWEITLDKLLTFILSNVRFFFLITFPTSRWKKIRKFLKYILHLIKHGFLSLKFSTTIDLLDWCLTEINFLCECQAIARIRSEVFFATSCHRSKVYFDEWIQAKFVNLTRRFFAKPFFFCITALLGYIFLGVDAIGLRWLSCRSL